MNKSKKVKTRESREDRVFHLLNYLFMILCSICILVPFMNIISSAFSDPSAVLNGKVTLLPVNPSLQGFKYVFQNKLIGTGYLNSILYTVLGTLISVSITVLAAYPLSRKELKCKKFFNWLFLFTMMFSGGMIPTYLVVKDLHMINSIWAVIIPNCLSIYNMIIARTFFNTEIPQEIYEAAEIDGAGDFTTLFKIVLPLSKAVLAVLVLFYAIGIWNMYFDAILYLNSYDKYPLQVILRDIMSDAQTQANMVQATGKMSSSAVLAMTESLKYTTILCASIPMLAIYPFVQKYFAKGVMIGSVKG